VLRQVAAVEFGVQGQAGVAAQQPRGQRGALGVQPAIGGHGQFRSLSARGDMQAGAAAHVHLFQRRERRQGGHGQVGIQSGFAARLPVSGPVRLLGTSGTVTTLASVYLGLPRYDRQAVDGLVVPAQSMRDIAARLSAMSLDERTGLPCIGDERADLVVAGCAILESILDIWPADRLGVADRGIREGILRALLDSGSRRKLG